MTMPSASNVTHYVATKPSIFVYHPYSAAFWIFFIKYAMREDSSRIWGSSNPSTTEVTVQKMLIWLTFGSQKVHNRQIMTRNLLCCLSVGVLPVGSSRTNWNFISNLLALSLQPKQVKGLKMSARLSCKLNIMHSYALNFYFTLMENSILHIFQTWISPINVFLTHLLAKIGQDSRERWILSIIVDKYRLATHGTFSLMVGKDSRVFGG